MVLFFQDVSYFFATIRAFLTVFIQPFLLVFPKGIYQNDFEIVFMCFWDLKVIRTFYKDIRPSYVPRRFPEKVFSLCR